MSAAITTNDYIQAASLLNFEMAEVSREDNHILTVKLMVMKMKNVTSHAHSLASWLFYFILGVYLPGSNNRMQ